ncbi:restriction endonuclease subunit S [Acidocella aminolytica]|uniref:Restriction modification system specificity determinant n=1 Tax=Acidocella aminolytica 101 = DSM 11237 TaxID=1120923 RepID=A0A0D6PME8_9PROT|nr:restriction endonuclease subunit S [Acidocella aminolytica]GAN81984.1 restriction modification system specificity determinant [Acidocella aminolytica 101 = DSM 11237]GBQ34778.1 restriction modification system DNA specificity domain [Acidocella aminolytica 101 = DSM 11237]SHF10156.1 type I restriction enzyme, S subunit [Acidocella aminolytica 101 = DSM 11237]
MLQKVHPSPTIQHVPLATLVLDVTTRNPGTKPNETFTYVDLSAVDQERKAIVGARALVGSEAPSRARQVICADDVLVSTVRPNLNGVALVPEDYDGAIASTGFCVLRPNRKLLDPVFLFQWVQSPAFVADMIRKATGASYPAVSDRIVQESLIPLPPLPEQRRIAAILDQADALRVKRREALAMLDEMAQAIFVEMFGDLRENALKWPIYPVSHYVSEFQGGKSLEANGDEISAKYRVLKISAVTGMMFRPTECKPLTDDYEPPSEHFVRPGDLLFSRANTTELVGAVAYVEETPPNLVLPDKLWRFVFRKPLSVDPLFIWALFQTPAVRDEIERRATGTSGSMKNISQGKLLALPTILPPLTKQREFTKRLRELQSVKVRQSFFAIEADSFFASLQHRAFTGTL